MPAKKTVKTTETKTVAKKAAADKETAKKTVKKAATKKATTTAKKATTTAKKAVAKEAEAKKPVAKKTTAKKAEAKKPAAKKTTAKKTTTKKTTAKKTTSVKLDAAAVQHYVDVINWKKGEAHAMDWLYIEVNAADLYAEIVDGSLADACKAVLDTMLEGDTFITGDEKATNEATLTVRYYCDNLSEDRKSYFEK